MTADLLDRLRVYAGLNHRGEVAVPEDVGRGPEHVHLLVDLPEDPAEHHLREGLLVSDDVAGSSSRLQEGGQLVVEGDDAVAAEKYRLHEARRIACHLVIEQEPSEDGKPKEPVRFFHQAVNGTGYRPTEIIYRNIDEYQQLLDTARAELRAFQKKYSRLTELADVFGAIEALA